MVVSYKVGESLAEWLPEYDWQYFYTVTCRKPRTDALALMRDIAEAPGYERMFTVPGGRGRLLCEVRVQDNGRRQLQFLRSR